LRSSCSRTVEIKAFISVMGQLNEISKVARKIFMVSGTKHILRISERCTSIFRKGPDFVLWCSLCPIDCLKASFHSKCWKFVSVTKEIDTNVLESRILCGKLVEIVFFLSHHIGHSFVFR
jgi:hypothetical protein